MQQATGCCHRAKACSCSALHSRICVPFCDCGLYRAYQIAFFAALQCHAPVGINVCSAEAHPLVYPQHCCNCSWCVMIICSLKLD